MEIIKMYCIALRCVALSCIVLRCVELYYIIFVIAQHNYVNEEFRL